MALVVQPNLISLGGGKVLAATADTAVDMPMAVDFLSITAAAPAPAL
jgi:hypothetical protein